MDLDTTTERWLAPAPMTESPGFFHLCPNGMRLCGPCCTSRDKTQNKCSMASMSLATSQTDASGLERAWLTSVPCPRALSFRLVGVGRVGHDSTSAATTRLPCLAGRNTHEAPDYSRRGSSFHWSIAASWSMPPRLSLRIEQACGSRGIAQVPTGWLNYAFGRLWVCWNRCDAVSRMRIIFGPIEISICCAKSRRRTSWAVAT